MSETVDAVLDHVAVAVRELEPAERRWTEQLGGRWVGWSDTGAFRNRQLRYRGGGKLELLAPSPADPSPDNFVRRYLDRFGSAVHHVTLKVADLALAIAIVRAEGLDVVDVQMEDAGWREGFLRPSQVGGLVIQLAWSSYSDDEWAARLGHTIEEPAPDAAVLRGPLLRHTDLGAAARLWTMLGADVDASDGMITCSWPGSPLTVVVERGQMPGPVGLRMDGAPALPAEPALGPAVLPT